ncbi:DMT family transporter [Bacillus sp. EB01]|uniref:DMT family transporter n=1 Tax=Bacillus sp. EB01 TaxID=1347086 RepID=UPI0005C449D8|nr:DMT family transporter [Bacillus sp. EB01]
MLAGLIIAIIGGAFVGIQNIFNSRVNEKAGTISTTTLVLGLGCFASFIIGIFVEGTAMFNLENMETWYWFGGLTGIGVVACIVQSFKYLRPTYAMSIVLVAQLAIAILFDTQGWLGLEKLDLTPNKLIGALVIVAGILVFKFAGQDKELAKE